MPGVTLPRRGNSSGPKYRKQEEKLITKSPRRDPAHDRQFAIGDESDDP
jgi:hypothetical protein